MNQLSRRNTVPDTTAVPLRRLQTARELAEQVGISKARVYELVRNGELPAVHLGRAVRFDPTVVAQWFATGGTAGNAR